MNVLLIESYIFRVNLWIETLMMKIQPVVTDENNFENQHKFLLIALIALFEVFGLSGC